MSAQQTSKRTVCPNCGQKFTVEPVFCPECDFLLGKQAVNKQALEISLTNKKRKIYFYAKIFGLIPALLIAIVGIGLFSSGISNVVENDYNHISFYNRRINNLAFDERLNQAHRFLDWAHIVGGLVLALTPGIFWFGSLKFLWPLLGLLLFWGGIFGAVQISSQVYYDGAGAKTMAYFFFGLFLLVTSFVFYRIERLKV